MPVVDQVTCQSTLPQVFFGGDAAFGPKNIIWAVAHGHEAAISIDLFCQRRGRRRPPAAGWSTLVSQKMGIHEWSYDNDISLDLRFKVPLRDQAGRAEATSRPRSSSASTASSAIEEAQRCLNCDVQTVFTPTRCASNATPASTSARWTASPSPTTARRTSCAARLKAPARNLDQDLYVSATLKTGRVMVKDEDVCLHCGLCAERCPTGAWDMQKFLLEMTQAEARRMPRAR